MFPQEIAALKKALSLVKVEFPYGLTSLTQFAMKKWGRSINGTDSDLFERLRRTTTPFEQYKSGTSQTLGSLVLQHAGKLCSEPRDAILAVLKLSKPINIRPNSSKSIADVYNEATRAITALKRNLNLICAMAKQSTSSDRLPRIELPSWVPRFESNISPYELYYCWIPYHKQDYYGGELLPSQKGRHSVFHSRVLEISGTFYDTIAHAEPKIDPGQYRTLDDFWTALKQLKSTTSAKGNLSDNSNIGLEFWRILLMDMYLEGVSRWTERVTRNRKARDSLESDLKEARNSTPSSRLLFQLRTHSDQKALCLTANGTFALVLGDVQAGD